jgi:hypothetical protein
MAIELSSSVPWFETFLRDFSLSIWSLLLFMVITGVVIGNIWRFAPVETADGRLRDMNLVLEESVDKSPSPLEGIEHVLNVVKTHTKDWDPRTIKSFLEHLAMRKDETGVEARRRLEEMREKREPT